MNLEKAMTYFNNLQEQHIEVMLSLVKIKYFKQIGEGRGLGILRVNKYVPGDADLWCEVLEGRHWRRGGWKPTDIISKFRPITEEEAKRIFLSGFNSED